MTQDEKTMLALASITYRGFLKREKDIAKQIVPWLGKLAGLGLGEWSLVWGPATFRAPTALVDDVMVYVARRIDSPSLQPRYVVAIRGTNPVSLLDWVLGDLWINLQIEWGPGLPGKISASTVLGLAIIKRLDFGDSNSPAAQLPLVGDLVARSFEQFADAVPELDPGVMLSMPTVSLDSMIERIRMLSQERVRTHALGRLFNELGHVGQPLEREPGHQVFNFLLSRINSIHPSGSTLLEFLDSTRVESRIAVIGHSKGGALATVVALWLHENWASSRGTQIECFSFAAPTPGDVNFRDHYNAKLKDQTHRVVNRLDIVPQAWVVEELRRIANTYAGLAIPLRTLATAIAPLRYAHVGNPAIQIASQPGGALTPRELVDQHLDAYLKDAGLPTEWNALSIFTSV